MATTEEFMTIAAREAITAYNAGTFSVGGLLVKGNGAAPEDLLKEGRNNVIVDGILNDPTAHGERQLVDWYYSLPKESRPDPKDVTVVTSLDPCCMCTGAILTAGFKAVVGAYDTFAGINYNKKFDFPSLPATDLKTKANSTFSYPLVENGTDCVNRLAQGESNIPFNEKKLEGSTVAICGSIFDFTLIEIRNKINADLPYSELDDIASLPDANPIIVQLKKLYPQALQYTSKVPFKPDEGLAPYLIEVMKLDKANGGPGNAVAMLDHKGHLLLCASGNQNTSAIQTAFMRCTRAYANLREELRRGDPRDALRVLRYLAHPKYCTFVFALGQDLSSQSFMDLGAYGSTMEGELAKENPHPLQYVHERISQADVDKLCHNLPPLYSKVIKVESVQVTNQELIKAIKPI